MEPERFDSVARVLGARTSRRLLAPLASVPLLGGLATLMAVDNAEAKKKKKKTFCLNGQTTVVKGPKKKLKKKVKKLRKQGAAPGACSPPPPPPTCTWTDQATFGASDLGNPHGVAMTPDGLTVLVAIINNHHISVWTRPNASSSSWTNQTTFGTQGSGDDNFDVPTGVAVTSDGLTALVADTENHRISVWTRTSATGTDWSDQTTFGSEGSGPDNFNAPYDVAVSSDGLTALVADLLNDRISVWTRTSANSTDWSNEDTFGSAGGGDENFNAPHDVALAADGLTALIADTNNDRISVWTRPDVTIPTGWSNQTTFGSSGSGPSNLNDPTDVALAADGLTALVADVVNDRISVWTRPNATSPTWTNQTTFGTEGSGPSNFAFPRGIAVTLDGQTAVVSDAGNDRMSVWALTCTT